MKTPEEIKKLLLCLGSPCKNTCEKCDYYVPGNFTSSDVYKLALAYVQQIERERDALLKLLKSEGVSCDTCKYEEESLEADSICVGCHYEIGIGYSGWQWRGVQEVE